MFNIAVRVAAGRAARKAASGSMRRGGRSRGRDRDRDGRRGRGRDAERAARRADEAAEEAAEEAWEQALEEAFGEEQAYDQAQEIFDSMLNQCGNSGQEIILEEIQDAYIQYAAGALRSGDPPAQYEYEDAVTGMMGGRVDKYDAVSQILEDGWMSIRFGAEMSGYGGEE